MTERHKAACVGKTHLFYGPANERGTAQARREAAAKTICGGCPLIVRCRDLARRYREHGTWGGETETERERAGYPPARLNPTYEERAS